MPDFRIFPASIALVATLTAFTPTLAQSSGGQAQEAAPAKTEARVSGKDEEAKVVCRKLRVTGTRIPKRVCRTEAEWAAVEAAARESGNTIKDAGAINTTPVPGG